MKKNLVILVALSMYVFLCGCPYEYTQPSSTPVIVPINVDPIINAATPGNNVPFWSGIMPSCGINVYFKFTNITSPTGGMPMYSMLIQTDTTTTIQLLDTCYFCNGSAGTANPVTIMEVVQFNQVNYFDHLFAAITTAPGSLNVLPLPTAVTNPKFQTPPAPPNNMQQEVINYIANIFGPNPTYPPMTDGGIDHDTEIRNATVLPINLINKQPIDSISHELKKNPNENGSIHLTRTMKIILTIFAFILGIIVGYMIKRKKRR